MDSADIKQPAKRKLAAASTRTRFPALSGDALVTYLANKISASASAITPAGALILTKADGHAATSPDIAAALEQLVGKGRAFQHPSASRSANAARAYSREPADAFVMQRLQAALRSGSEFTLPKLRAVVPKEYRELIDQSLGTLLNERKLFEKPGSARTKTYTTTPLPATSVLTAVQRKTLEGILSKVNAARPQPLRLAELLQFLDGRTAPHIISDSVSGVVSQAAPTFELLKELYDLDLPSRGGLSSMPIPLTWRRYASHSEVAGGGPDRAGFERLLLECAAAGRIELTAHEWPATLASPDLAAAIRQPDGRVLYYWRPVKEQ